MTAQRWDARKHKPPFDRANVLALDVDVVRTAQTPMRTSNPGGDNRFLSLCLYAFFTLICKKASTSWSMRPWESDDPQDQLERGSESQGRMDQDAAQPSRLWLKEA
jgi:hypothetical protein